MNTPLTDEALIELGFEEVSFVNEDQDDVEYFKHPVIIGLLVRNGLVHFALAEYPEVDTIEKLTALIETISS